MEARIKKIIETTLSIFEEYVEERRHSIDGLKYEIVEDNKHFRYQLLLMGWQGKERIYHVVFHVDIINGKLWVQEDNTEKGLANMLTEKGIAKQDIVLAYFSEFHRQFTEFAPA